MSIQVGQPAPDFSLRAHDASEFRLAAHRGEHVLLLFFPGAFSDVCTSELNQINNDLQTYEGLNSVVVGISTDSIPVLGAFRTMNRLQFPLLSDHNADVCALYGTKYDPGTFVFDVHRVSRRAAVLVDAAGTIRYAEVLEDADELPDLESIKATLRSLGG